MHADELGDTFTDDMVERIDEKLGHPDRCPHGWPVDPDVEQAENRELEPLSDARAGRRARRSSGSPSTTATSCTGSTTRALVPGAAAVRAAERCGSRQARSDGVSGRRPSSSRRRGVERVVPTNGPTRRAPTTARREPGACRRPLAARREVRTRRRSGRADELRLGGAATRGSTVAEAGGGAERVGLVGALPREVVVVAAEVAVRGGLRVDRPAQVEVAQDRGRAQVEVLARRAPRCVATGDVLASRTSRRGSRTGRATPIAYATWIWQRSASPAATTFFAT